MSSTSLFLPQSPWFYVAVASSSDITDFARTLGIQASATVVVRFLRGRKMLNLDALHNEIGAALQFPWYYGENWAALDECINDLEWLPADCYVLIIVEAEDVLKENKEEFSVLIKTLQHAAIEWSTVDTADHVARQRASFHVIFQCAEGKESAFISRLSATGAMYQRLEI